MAFYQDQLGFSVQPYPYCRPGNGKGVFEPLQPKKSVYLAPTTNNSGMGILLIPATKKNKLKVNPAIGELTLVYQPSSSSSSGEDENGASASTTASPVLVDPSNVSIRFQSVSDLEKEEAVTR